MSLPTLVYKCPGEHQRPGGTFACRGVSTDKELQAALTDGWHKSLPDAIDYFDGKLAPKSIEPITTDLLKEAVDDAPPTREELEAQATELEIKFDGRTTDAVLTKKIEEAMAE